MSVIADLQLHSKYARAVSQNMVLPEIAKWSRLKGIQMVATGDWTHPLWLREIKAHLEETQSGLFTLKKEFNDEFSSNGNGPYFLLETEVSSIYSQGGKLRRIHNLIWAPSVTTVDKINAELTKRGSNLMSDGRPIIGISSRDLAEIVFSIDQRCLIIPAHCLLPGTLIHTNSGMKDIDLLRIGEKVLTHSGRFRKITEIYNRFYSGKVYTIKPWYFSQGLTTTEEHPFLGIRTVKECKSTGDICRPSDRHIKRCSAKHYNTYQPEWIPANRLEVGDILLFPRVQGEKRVRFINLSDYLDKNSGFVTKDKIVVGKGSRLVKINNQIPINKGFCLLIGYYLAEGYIDKKGGVSFAFGSNEYEYIEDIKRLMVEVFGLGHYREYQRKKHKGVELIYYSKIVAAFLKNFCYGESDRLNATIKQIPQFFLTLPKDLQAEVIRGWWRGDRGYTSSRTLANQLKLIFLRLGIIPSIYIDSQADYQRRGKHVIGSRIINANRDSICLTRLAFFKDDYGLLREKEYSVFATKLNRRHGWIDEKYIYLPVRSIVIEDYRGKVYNIEVEEDNSYTAEFACIHNCWTPWFSLYGSESGFNSIDECFGDYAEYIYAIETGLSSDPAMNWRIKELDNRRIVSFSDAHSGPKLGREATVFRIKNSPSATLRRDKREEEMEQLTYDEIRKVIQGDATAKWEIGYTVEFYPEEGKYHYTGHRNCNIRHSPEETEKLGVVCPVCGRKLTVGVMHRVEELAGRTQKELGIRNQELGKGKVKAISSSLFPNRPPYVMLVPLQEILSESLHVAPTSQKVQAEYRKLVDALGGEFAVLLNTEPKEIEKLSGPHLADAIVRVRKGDIVVDPGYDGVFGKVKIWPEGEGAENIDEKKQLSLF